MTDQSTRRNSQGDNSPPAGGDEATYRITMTLRDGDLRRAAFLEKALEARSKADAISQAMGIAELVLVALTQGREVILRTPGQDTAERIVLPKVNLAAASSIVN